MSEGSPRTMIIIFLVTYKSFSLISDTAMQVALSSSTPGLHLYIPYSAKFWPDKISLNLFSPAAQDAHLGGTIRHAAQMFSQVTCFTRFLFRITVQPCVYTSDTGAQLRAQVLSTCTQYIHLQPIKRKYKLSMV